MRTIVFGIILFRVFTGHSQHMNQQIRNNYPTQLFFGTTRAQVYRSLLPNENFLAVPLGERGREVPMYAWSQQLGIQVGLSKHFLIEGGLSYMQNGEGYSWKALDTDSSFSYQTRYRYLALPIQLKCSFGQKFSFYTGAGFIPALYLSYVQDQQWTNPFGAKYDNQIKVNNTMNSFAFAWTCSAGFELPLNPTLRLRVGLQYRQQLTNSYDPYQDYIHKSKAFCYNFGLSKKI
ncbi:MAG: outer membrane beta-barrel protein [Flavobacteriales bacterium]